MYASLPHAGISIRMLYVRTYIHSCEKAVWLQVQIRDAQPSAAGGTPGVVQGVAQGGG